MDAENQNELHTVHSIPQMSDSGEKSGKPTGVSGSEYGAVVEVDQFTALQKKRILRKIDWHLVPLLSFLYLVSFIDRGNRELLVLDMWRLRRMCYADRWTV